MKRLATGSVGSPRRDVAPVLKRQHAGRRFRREEVGVSASAVSSFSMTVGIVERLRAAVDSNRQSSRILDQSGVMLRLKA